MTLPRSAADVLADHVLFEIEAIDRMYLNLYQPRLQHGAGIAAFFVGHRGHRFASSALMAPMTRAFVADIGHFIAARGLDLVRFAPGQRKDLVTAGYLRRAETDDRGLVPAQVLAMLPYPFTAEDNAAGYRYELSVLQAEFSLTQALDAPVTGRIFFEQLIRDNLDIGRPDRVGLIFGRRVRGGRKRPTPGRFRTRVITD